MRYAKEARLVLPGTDGTQGVVVDATETVPGFPVYTLRWLTEAGETQTGTVGEGDLHDRNPSERDVAEHEVAEMVREDEIKGEVERRVEAKLAQIRRSKRKPSDLAKKLKRKSKSKSKR